MLLERVHSLIKLIEYPGIDFEIFVNADGLVVIYCVAELIDNERGVLSKQKGRPWLLWLTATDQDIVQTAFKAVLTFEEHEIREKFKYRGEAIYAPHFAPDDLVDLVERVK